jgi:phosphonatase-like hydrolase
MIKLVVFDLSGTTVSDDNAVAKCLFRAAKQYGLAASLEDFEKTIGTNKIHLYEFLLARESGIVTDFAQLESKRFPQFHARALEIFDEYSLHMVAFYRNEVKPMEGAEEVFQWCQDNQIRVATDTGFHRDVSNAIMEGLKWKERRLIDLHLDVEDTNGIGRPAPYLIHKAMYMLGITSVHDVVKIGDTPADLLSGYNAGCKGNIGVLSGANDIETLKRYPHTHIIEDVRQLPELITKEFNQQ